MTTYYKSKGCALAVITRFGGNQNEESIDNSDIDNTDIDKTDQDISPTKNPGTAQNDQW